jgi:F-type H+-transporting ATPase subunit alpha
LEGDLFYSGIRPAINVGLSVSRVGGKGQTKAMRQVAGRLRLDLAQYKELAAFTQFGSELDKTTQMQLTRGERMVEILKQDQYQPLNLSHQVMIIYAGVNGLLDDLPKEAIQRFEAEFYQYVHQHYPDLIHDIEMQKELTNPIQKKLNQAVSSFKNEFIRQR